jgi:hypothetical protein
MNPSKPVLQPQNKIFLKILIGNTVILPKIKGVQK